MEFTYENQGTNTYLVYRIAENDNLDTLSLGMLTNNKITGLIPAIFTQMDGERFIKFNVSAKVSVRQFFTGVVNKKRLTGVFTGIVNAMISAEEYMINPDNILIDLDYIYTDVSTCETNLICLPIVEEQAQSVDLGAMFKNIVFSTQFDQTENCDYVAKIINYLNSSPVFSLENFKEILDEIMTNVHSTQQSVVQPHVQQTAVHTTVQQPTVQASAQQMSMQTSTQQSSVQIPVQQSSVQTLIQQPTAPPFVQQSVQQPEKKQQKQNAQHPVQGQPQMAQPSANAQEKQISMMTLLTHYNKENKELYKKQKEQKKSLEQIGKKKEKKRVNADFAIPGQELPDNGAVAFQNEKTKIVQPSAPCNIAPNPVQMSTTSPVQSVEAQAGNVFPRATANFGETTVLNAGNRIGETTVLNAVSAQMEIRPYLLRIKDNSKIIIDKPVFRIGKERSYVDYFIGDNSAISRSHANIVVRGEEYFVIDTNSTNHTYVDGIMIQSNVETKLSHGTNIQFANEEFEFKLY